MKQYLYIFLAFLLCNTGGYAAPKDGESGEEEKQSPEHSVLDNSQRHGAPPRMEVEPEEKRAIMNYIGALKNLFLQDNLLPVTSLSARDLSKLLLNCIEAQENYRRCKEIVPLGQWQEWNLQVGAFHQVSIDNIFRLDEFINSKGNGYRDFFSLIADNKPFLRSGVGFCHFPYGEYFSSILTKPEECIKKFNDMFAVVGEFANPDKNSSPLLLAEHPMYRILSRLKELPLLNYTAGNYFTSTFGQLFFLLGNISDTLRDPKNIVSVVPRVVGDHEVEDPRLSGKQLKKNFYDFDNEMVVLYKECSEGAHSCYKLMQSLATRVDLPSFESEVKNTKEKISVTQKYVKEYVNKVIESTYALLENAPTSSLYDLLYYIVYEGKILFEKSVYSDEKCPGLLWRMANNFLNMKEDSKEMIPFLEKINSIKVNEKSPEINENSIKMKELLSKTLEEMKVKAPRDDLSHIEEQVCDIIAMYLFSTSIIPCRSDEFNMRDFYFNVSIGDQKIEKRIQEISKDFLNNLPQRLDLFRVKEYHSALTRGECIVLKLFDIKVTDNIIDPVPVFVENVRNPFKLGPSDVDQKGYAGIRNTGNEEELEGTCRYMQYRE